ncbi:MAG: hypothetical protein COA78_05075 [Blastopirellula sp.]|nr:MAG: hypothetical protein COA78_05075 [Blastopirellula sp.]
MLTLWLCAFAQAAPPEAIQPEKRLTFFKKHCFDCHDSETQEGKVNLESLPLHITTIEQAEAWQKVLNALNSGEMPPEDETQPGNTEKADFLDDLAQSMVAARNSLSDSGGKITMRRLNRREYQNTIQQLTGVKVDVGSLPTDGGAGYFDTAGASQYISSDQFEQYLKLGRNAIDEAFERQAGQDAKPMVFRVEPEETINPENELLVKTIEETYERFTRWQAGVDKAAVSPGNQEIIAKLRKKNPSIDHPIHFYKSANLLEGTPNPNDFGFRDAQTAALSNPDWDRAQLAYHKHYLGLPHRDNGTYLKVAYGTGRIDITPSKLPPGTYKISIRAGVVDGSPSSRHFIQIGHPQRQVNRIRGLEGNPISSHQVTGTIEHPEIIETELTVGANTPREFSIEEKQPYGLKSLWDAHNKHKRTNGYGHPPAIWIDWVELEGPLEESGHVQKWKQRREVEKHANRKVGGTFNGYFKGGYEAAQAFLKDGKTNKGIPDEQEARFRIKTYEKNAASFQRYLNHPLTKTGSLLTIMNVNKEEIIALPPAQPSGWLPTKHVVDTVPSGEYKIRFRIGALEGTEKERHFVELGSRSSANDSEFNLIKTLQVNGTSDKPQELEISVSLTSDGPRKFVLREKRNLKLDGSRVKNSLKETGSGPIPALWIDWVEWEGPLSSDNKNSSPKILFAKNTGMSEKEHAREVLKRFAIRAFRQTKPDEVYLDQLLKVFEIRRSQGDAFDVAIRSPLSAILASPGFLYLNEPGIESDPRSLSDLEIAVRLSYFLWSSPPDTQLLNLAEAKKLHQPEILRQQVSRMIADPRSGNFVSGFVHQWLDMERLDFFQFDVNLHREFDESTRTAAREEVYQSFAHLLRNKDKGQLGNLLSSDYVIINGLLATYYGIDGVTGDEFRKVKLPADSPRGGLLGMAAIHAMGSDGVNSSPVERGAWVWRKLLNDPPPPAPPNVPQISRLAGQVLTTRERLLAHQEQPQCASCHRKIDPIGFGLENWDAAGKWRTQDSYSIPGQKRKTWEIDASGAFHKGPSFEDYFEMRDLIAAREDDFAQGFTEALIEYALGRPFGFSDEKLATQMVTSAKSQHFSINEFIHTLVQSKEFQTK